MMIIGGSSELPIGSRMVFRSLFLAVRRTVCTHINSRVEAHSRVEHMQKAIHMWRGHFVCQKCAKVIDILEDAHMWRRHSCVWQMCTGHSCMWKKCAKKHLWKIDLCEKRVRGLFTCGGNSRVEEMSHQSKYLFLQVLFVILTLIVKTYHIQTSSPVST